MPAAAPASLVELAARFRPHLLAGEETLPLEPALAELLGTPGLRRGSTLVVEGAAGSGSTTLALALTAAASGAGAWVAAVDLPRLGVLAASELGLATDRIVLVPDSGRRFATVVSALLEACDIVLATAPDGLDPSLARRLAVRARERRAVLVVTGGGAAGASRTPAAGAWRAGKWPEGADARLTAFPAGWSVTGGGEPAGSGQGFTGEGASGLGWTGLGAGYGHLSARLVEIVVTRRRSATPRVRARLWLPSPSGTIALALPLAPGATAPAGASLRAPVGAEVAEADAGAPPIGLAQ